MHPLIITGIGPVDHFYSFAEQLFDAFYVLISDISFDFYERFFSWVYYILFYNAYLNLIHSKAADRWNVI